LAIVVREDWLSYTREEIVEPSRRVIDPHQHFFSQNPAFPRYDLTDLWRDTSGHQIQKTVFLQCWEGYRADGADELKPVGETQWADRIARASHKDPTKAQVSGIVGTAELRLGVRVREVLEAHKAASGLFRGIRQMAPWDASPEVMSLDDVEEGRIFLNPKFREGVAVLQDMDLIYETWIYHPHIRHLISLARALPGVKIVLDHMGSPLGVGPYVGCRAEVFKEWSRDITELAGCSNVTLKLGGLLMPWQGFGFEGRPRAPTSDEIIEEQRHYYEHAIEAFGSKRCMFQSNFPVEKNAVSYDVLWNAFKKIAAGCSESEKDDLFFSTAATVYRL
jgi:predicted TIM-barrel fold metal-dependent hydrolase